jgi:hypothetical protein
MVELRKSLDNLGTALEDDEPYEFDPVGTIEIEEHEHEAGVEEARAAMDDLAIDADATPQPSISVDPPVEDELVQGLASGTTDAKVCGLLTLTFLAK